MIRRNILPDCCEDWILEFGEFYETGEKFSCLECATAWQKLGNDRFIQLANQKVFKKSFHRAGASEFAYLASEDGDNPLIERCCAKLLIKHGPTTRIDEFHCPICHTAWQKTIVNRGGISVASFNRDGLEEPFAVQKGTTRSFLVPVSSYSPPLE